MKLESSKCLVIGIAGFIGSYTVSEPLMYPVNSVKDSSWFLLISKANNYKPE
ncbi:MAG: hypothetical protein IT267_01725 [Saprospiraceae bacterium]|nr:hypothetical protein [Saprospiraceae bacterium]